MKRRSFKIVLASLIYLTKLFIVALTTIPVFAAESDLDTSFDGDGRVTTGSFYEEGGRDVAIQPDGKIVVVGGKTSTYQIQNMAAVRYNINGSLDTTFGNNGVYVLPSLIGSQVAAAKAVAVDLQPDGKILLAGSGGTLDDAKQIFLIIRLNANGTLDTTFGDGGRVIKKLASSNTYGRLSSMVFDAARDKIYLGGTIQLTSDGAAYGYAVMRFTGAGAPDTTFNGTGTQAFQVGDSRPSVTGLNDIALQPDGKLVATGFAQYLIANTPSIESFGTARINLDGSLDSPFGTNGVVITDFTHMDFGTISYYRSAARTVSLLPNGKIFIGGGGSNESPRTFYYAAQLNPGGDYDSSFGTNGRIRADGFAVLDSAIDLNGKIVIAGGHFAVGRLNANGALDKTFNSTGFVVTDFGSAETTFAVALQTNGKIVVSGGSTNPQYSGPGNDYTHVARYIGTAQVSSLPTLSISATDGSSQESTTDSGTFTFTRTGDSTNPLAVNYTVLSSSASAAHGIRYVLPSPLGVANFPAGAASLQIQVTPLADPAILGTQTVELAISSSTGYEIAAASKAVVALLDSPFNEWRISKFGGLAAAQSPAAGANVSASTDGLANLVKYALGLDPLVPAPHSAIPGASIEPVSGQNFLIFSFRVPLPAPADITYFPEISATLGASDWFPAVPHSGFPINNGDGTETRKYRSATPAGDSPFRGFARLRITRP